MRLTIPQSIARSLLVQLGTDRAAWEKFLSQMADIEIQLPRFFLEVENYSFRQALELTLGVTAMNGWLPVNYHYSLEGLIKKRLSAICRINRLQHNMSQ